ncbi:MAG: tetratricopeptide repeat protein [Patescibacteria group bacterium]
MNTNDSQNWLKIFFSRPFGHPFFWITLIISIAYFSTLFYGLVYLDDNVLVKNDYQYDKNLSNIFQAFGEDIFRMPHQGGSFYRPIERITFILDAQLGEGALVFMSHFTNVLLHIASVFLLFVFLVKLNIKKETALLLSLIFSVHPLTAQTVSFIPGRNDSLLAVFVFPALIFFMNFLRNPKRKYYLWHLIFFALALFTKETAAVLPLICGVYILIFSGIGKIIADRKKYLYLLAGWGSVLLFWFLVRRAVLNNFIGNADYHIVPSIIKNLPSLLPAIGKIILPFSLSVFPAMKDMAMIYGTISLILLAIWFILAKNKNYKMIFFGASWFFLFILLTLIKPADTVPDFSENRIYLPMFGFIFVFLGLGKIKFPGASGNKEGNQRVQENAIFIISLLLIIVFSSVTIYRNKYYKDRLSFWNNAVETSPSFAFNHNNLGAMYYLDKNLNAAEPEFKKALELNPREKMAHNNLGLIYMDEGNFEKAEEEYNKEIEINPSYDNAYFNRGLLYYKMGRKEGAEKDWKMTLAINPNYDNALYNLAVYYYEEKNFKEAALYAGEIARRGLPLQPEMQRLLNPLLFQ